MSFSSTSMRRSSAWVRSTARSPTAPCSRRPSCRRRTTCSTPFGRPRATDEGVHTPVRAHAARRASALAAAMALCADGDPFPELLAGSRAPCGDPAVDRRSAGPHRRHVPRTERLPAGARRDARYFVFDRRGQAVYRDRPRPNGVHPARAGRPRGRPNCGREHLRLSARKPASSSPTRPAGGERVQIFDSRRRAPGQLPPAGARAAPPPHDWHDSCSTASARSTSPAGRS